MSEADPMELPVFELPLAILPRERTGLHIFEERYKRMVNDSLDSSQPFGILLRDDDGPREVGCSVIVDSVLERYEDGRFDIIVQGAEPFRVIERIDTPERPAARVATILEDGSGLTDEEAASAAREAFIALAERSPAEPPSQEEIEAEDAYGIAGRVELPPETKQRLLELRDEDDRMQLVAEALEVAGKALENAEERAAQATSNGHVNGSSPG